MGVSTFADKQVGSNDVRKQQKQDLAPVCLQLAVGWFVPTRTMELTLTQFLLRGERMKVGHVGFECHPGAPYSKVLKPKSLCLSQSLVRRFRSSKCADEMKATRMDGIT